MCRSGAGRSSDPASLCLKNVPVLIVGARKSPLSQAQVQEVQRELGDEVMLSPLWVDTRGDLDRTVSLRLLEKTDFFTRELDEMLLNQEIDAAIHSAKDLPDPLPSGLEIGALTGGVDPRDSLVFREGKTIHTLEPGAIVATSSWRREEEVKKIRSDFSFIDLRGTIHERLEKLQKGEADAIVVAEAALIRLNLVHLNRCILPGATTPLQGRLAVLIRKGDEKTKTLFSKIHVS